MRTPQSVLPRLCHFYLLQVKSEKAMFMSLSIYLFLINFCYQFNSSWLVMHGCSIVAVVTCSLIYTFCRFRIWVKLMPVSLFGVSSDVILTNTCKSFKNKHLLWLWYNMTITKSLKHNSRLLLISNYIQIILKAILFSLV